MSQITKQNYYIEPIANVRTTTNTLEERADSATMNKNVHAHMHTHISVRHYSIVCIT